MRAFEQTNYPLTLISGPGCALSLKVSYDRARFDDAACSGCWATCAPCCRAWRRRHLHRARLGDLPLLTEAEQRELAAWNATAASLPGADLCLHTLFEQQVARTPDAIALIAEIAPGRRPWLGPADLR